MLKGSLEIIEFEPRQVAVDAAPREYPCESDDLWSRLRLEHRTLTSCAAAFLALGLHLLVVAPAFMGEEGVVRRTQEPYRGDVAMQWVVLGCSFSWHIRRHTPASELPFPDASHTFVIVTDPSTGASYASRGGPGSGGGGGPGIGWDQVTAVSGPYNSRFPDYGSVTAVQNVGYLDIKYNTVVGYLNSFAATTGANDLRYEGYTQNSNSYSAALLNGLGFTPPSPIKNAPGYGSNPPSPQLECKP